MIIETLIYLEDGLQCEVVLNAGGEAEAGPVCQEVRRGDGLGHAWGGTVML